MRFPDFKAAQLQAPSGGGSDPGWLQGAWSGRPAILLGGAGGLLESPALHAAEGQLVIGSNWTLRALVPSIWQVHDRKVWMLERGHLDKCSESLVVLANRGIFGAGAYSTKGSRLLKMVGAKEVRTFEFDVADFAPGGKIVNRHFIPPISPPYMPESFGQPHHPGGNSLCYMIQTAHLMGCDPIYCLGFTLEAGTGYFFGLTNPATQKRSYWINDHPIDWLRWYQKTYPNRVRLLPGWQGPVYDLLPTEDHDVYERILGWRSREAREGQAEPDAGALSWNADGGE